MSAPATVVLEIEVPRELVDALDDLAELGGSSREKILLAILSSLPRQLAVARQIASPLWTAEGRREFTDRIVELIGHEEDAQTFGAAYVPQRGKS